MFCAIKMQQNEKVSQRFQLNHSPFLVENVRSCNGSHLDSVTCAQASIGNSLRFAAGGYAGY